MSVICKNCNSEVILIPLQRAVLWARVAIPGEKATEAYKTLGIDAKIAAFELRLKKDGERLSDEKITAAEFTCGDCGTTGTLKGGEFTLVDQCRCGTRAPDEIIPCSYYTTIVCEFCREKSTCKKCSRKCEYAGRKSDNPEESATPGRRNPVWLRQERGSVVAEADLGRVQTGRVRGDSGLETYSNNPIGFTEEDLEDAGY